MVGNGGIKQSGIGLSHISKREGTLSMGTENAEESARTPEVKIAFIHYQQTEGGDGYHGGTLVTDSSGKPLEFRSTSIVRPNLVQRTLYGRTLLDHLAQELFAIPLMGALREEPDLVLVRDETLLDIRPRVECPVLHVRRQGEAIQMPRAGEQESEAACEVVASPSGRFQPVIVTPHWQYGEEARRVRGELEPVFARMDLLEPFERVERALEELAKQEAADAS